MQPIRPRGEKSGCISGCICYVYRSLRRQDGKNYFCTKIERVLTNQKPFVRTQKSLLLCQQSDLFILDFTRYSLGLTKTCDKNQNTTD